MQTFFELDALVKKEDLESWESTSTKLSLVKWNFANVLSVGARQAEARSAARHSQSSWQPEFIRICIFFRMNFLGRFFYSGLLKTWDGLHNKINTCLKMSNPCHQNYTGRHLLTQAFFFTLSARWTPWCHDHARLDPVVGMRCVCFRYFVGTYEPGHNSHFKQSWYQIRRGVNIQNKVPAVFLKMMSVHTNEVRNRFDANSGLRSPRGVPHPWRQPYNKWSRCVLVNHSDSTYTIHAQLLQTSRQTYI